MRASYRLAIEWIALNDGPADDESLNLSHVSEMVTTSLIADLFGKSTEEVAKAIIKFRIKNREAL